MPLSKYILRGKTGAANPPAVIVRNPIELLIRLDSEAQKTPSDAMAKVKRHYQKQTALQGGQIDWEKPVLALPPPEVKPNQLLFSFPGIEVYELSDAQPAQTVGG